MYFYIKYYIYNNNTTLQYPRINDQNVSVSFMEERINLVAGPVN